MRAPIVRLCWLTAGLCCLAACLRPPPARSTDAATIVSDSVGVAIDEWLRQAADSGFSGVVLVEVEGSVVIRKGYGWTDSTGTYSITPTTRFFTASVTKGFTGAAILTLRERGLLELDQPLTDFFEGVPPAYAATTIRQLLVHRSGLDNNYGGTGFTDRDRAVADVLSHPSAYAAGKDFLYSNDNYALLAAIVEVAAGVPYEEYLQAILLDPAGMDSAGFWGLVDERDAASFAQLRVALPDSIRAPNWGYRGADGLAASVVDLHRWASALLDGSVLNADLVGELFGPHHTLGSGIGVGYGWFVSATPERGTENWSRGGDDYGHNAVIRWFPDRETLVIVLSSSEFAGQEANRSVSDGVLGVLWSPAR